MKEPELTEEEKEQQRQERKKAKETDMFATDSDDDDDDGSGFEGSDLSEEVSMIITEYNQQAMNARNIMLFGGVGGGYRR